MDNQRLYAVISDIHANYQALVAVEEDAQNLAQEERLGEPRFVCLGDVVDFGPQPNECMDWVRHRADIVIQGNHDAAAADRLYIPPVHHDINRDYWPITLWTRQTLADNHKHTIREWKPKRRTPPGLRKFTLFHGRPTSQTGRIEYGKQATRYIQKLHTRIYYGLFGHTHCQGYFVEGKSTTFLTCPDVVNSDSDENWQTVPVGSWEPLPNGRRKAIFNPGSVGQPRLHSVLVPLNIARDPRAAYMLLLVGSNGNSRFQFRRVDYDVDETVRQLRENVRWSENGKRPQEGNDILKDKDSPSGLWDPDKAYLKEMLREMPERLEQLVEETLIPTLEGRS